VSPRRAGCHFIEGWAIARHVKPVERSLTQQMVADSVCSLCLARVRIVKRLDEQTLVVACVGCGTVGWIEEVARV
jgi:hypothetical protein